MRLRTMLATVDFPLPDSPTRARVVPSRRVKETSSTALSSLAFPLAPRTLKTLVRFSTRMTASVAVAPSPAPRSSSSVTLMPRAWAASIRWEASEGAACTRRLV